MINLRRVDTSRPELCFHTLVVPSWDPEKKRHPSLEAFTSATVLQMACCCCVWLVSIVWWPRSVWVVFDNEFHNLRLPGILYCTFSSQSDPTATRTLYAKRLKQHILMIEYRYPAKSSLNTATEMASPLPPEMMLSFDISSQHNCFATCLTKYPDLFRCWINEYRLLYGDGPNRAHQNETFLHKLKTYV